MLQTIIVDSQVDAKYAMIWCHGLGTSAEDFLETANEIQQATAMPIRFILPNAELRTMTVNPNRKIRAWFDVLAFGSKAPEDRVGLDNTAKEINDLIEQQIQLGIPCKNILLGGFSQGAAAILYAGLRYPQPLASLVVFSGYLPFYHALPAEKNVANQQTAIFWGHGLQDRVVPYLWAEKVCANALVSAGYTLSFNAYEAAHEISKTAIMTLANWIKQNLAEK